MRRRKFGVIIPKPSARQSLAKALACLLPAPICDSTLTYPAFLSSPTAGMSASRDRDRGRHRRAGSRRARRAVSVRGAGSVSSADLHLRNRHHEPPTPVADIRHLLHDFVLQIPGQDQHVVRPCFLDLFGVEDRNVRSWQELALLVRAAVHGVVEEVGADAAVIEQGVPLARGAVTGDRLPFALGLDEEGQQLALRLLDLLLEARRSTPACRSRPPPPGLSISRTRSPTGFEVSSRMARIDSQRPAVGGQFLHVEDRQAVRGRGSSRSS